MEPLRFPSRRAAGALRCGTKGAAMASEQTLERPYLAGNYAPIHAEIDAADLRSTGAIPRDLEGVFVRTGANPRFPIEGRHHWFDGDGMIHAVHFEGGRASYRNRWVRTKAFVAEE